MAKKSSHNIVLEFKHPERGDAKAYSRKGVVLERAKGGTWKIAGKVKPGLSVANIDKIMIVDKGYVRAGGPVYVPADFVFRTEEQAAKETKAKVKRQERARKLEAETLEREARYLDLPLVRGLDWNLPNAIELVRYMVNECRAERRPLDTYLNYVYVMARFHGGASSASLHGPIMAGWGVDREDLPMLDQIADLVAREAFGSHMRAARVWGRALYGH